MTFLRNSFIVLLTVLATAGVLGAQSPACGVQKESLRRAPGPATGEEIQSLRDTLAAQQKQIEELSTALRRLTEANPQAQTAPRHDRNRAAEEERSPTDAAGPVGHPKFSAAEGKTTERLRLEGPAEQAVVASLQGGWNGEHFFLNSSDGSFGLEPFGYLQLDYRGYSGDATPTDTFAIRRGRFGFQGSLGKLYQFTLLADFADKNGTLVREFSFNANYRPELQFKFGQFKEPFSQEELVSAPYIDFVERSLVVNLVPAYSPGFQVHGQFRRGAIQYQLGAFNGKGFLKDNDTSTPEGVLRLRFSPWRDASKAWLKGLALGGAVAQGRTQNGTSFSGLLPTRTFAFFKAEPINGKALRANGELTWIKGPVALRAEYDQTNQERAGLGPSKTNLPGVLAKGYYVTATYLLTGENRPDNGQPVPRHAFRSGGGIGAWELKFRYSNLQMEDGTFRNRADQFSTGVNWYPTALVRYMLDFNVERLKNPISSPVALAPQSFLSVLQRVQFRF